MENGKILILIKVNFNIWILTDNFRLTTIVSVDRYLEFLKLYTDSASWLLEPLLTPVEFLAYPEIISCYPDFYI